MHSYRHPVAVRNPKDFPKPQEVLWFVQDDVRVAKMQLHSIPQMGILGAANEFCGGLLFQRIDAARATKPVRISSHFLTRPIVLALNSIQLVHDARSIPIGDLIGQGKDHGSLNASLVQQLDQIRCGDDGHGRSARLSTKEMLMMIDKRRWLCRQRHNLQQVRCAE